MTCVPRPEQLVRSTPLLPCGMPKDAGKERGHVGGRRGGSSGQLIVISDDFSILLEWSY